VIELLCEILQRFLRVERRQDEILNKIQHLGEHMATQADIDALTTRLETVDATLTAGLSGVRQDIADLKAANPGVDTAALEASVAALETGVTGLSELDSENPAPAGP
jgi:hypothetical protein